MQKELGLVFGRGSCVVQVDGHEQGRLNHFRGVQAEAEPAQLTRGQGARGLQPHRHQPLGLHRRVRVDAQLHPEVLGQVQQRRQALDARRHHRLRPTQLRRNLLLAHRTFTLHTHQAQFQPHLPPLGRLQKLLEEIREFGGRACDSGDIQERRCGQNQHHRPKRIHLGLHERTLLEVAPCA